ncbi:hypothetical protein [Saccharopolyspora sp. NPDC002686]|uniref:hypothetical protein n=1 Tax=Saccharopolyspora sp. NPDC002686 TaxID=3154541 RepID=UPI00331FCD29
MDCICGGVFVVVASSRAARVCREENCSAAGDDTSRTSRGWILFGEFQPPFSGQHDLRPGRRIATFLREIWIWCRVVGHWSAGVPACCVIAMFSQVANWIDARVYAAPFWVYTDERVIASSVVFTRIGEVFSVGYF